MALQRHNNTEAKKLDGDLKFLMDGENLASLIGLLQILDHYAWVSVEAQNVMKFPTTVFSSLMDMLDRLSEDWSWRDQFPRLCQVGTFRDLVKQMLPELGGSFSPLISPQARRRFRARLTLKENTQREKIERLRSSGMTDIAITRKLGIEIPEPPEREEHALSEDEDEDEDEMADPPMRINESVPVTFTFQKSVQVTKKLEEAAKSLASAVRKRMKPVEIISKAVETFSDDQFLDDEEHSLQTASDRMKELYSLVDRWRKTTIDPEALTPGYLKFMKFRQQKLYHNPNLTLEKIYEEFYRDTADDVETSEFKRLFQYIKIKHCRLVYCCSM